MLIPETISQHSREAYEFHCIYFLPWKDQMVESIRAVGGKVQCIPASNNLKILWSARGIAAYINQHQIQILHCHLPWAGIVGRIAGKLAGVPVVYTEHNKWERYHKLTFALNKATFGWQNLAIAVSKDVEQSIRKYHQQSRPQIITVLNGVNTQKFQRNPQDAAFMRLSAELGWYAQPHFIIGTVSVFRVQKRLTTWLEVARRVHQKHPDTRFLIVGDGPLRQEVDAFIAKHQMQDYVHLAGLQTDVQPYFNLMQVFMMASEFEGLPIALLEAMSMGCIPVCTKAGGIGEVVRDGVEGKLVEVSQPLALVSALNELLATTDHERSKLVEAARRRVEEAFSLGTMVNQLEDWYEKMIS